MCVYVYLHIYSVCVCIFFLQTRPTKLGIIKSPVSFSFTIVFPVCQWTDCQWDLVPKKGFSSRLPAATYTFYPRNVVRIWIQHMITKSTVTYRRKYMVSGRRKYAWLMTTKGEPINMTIQTSKRPLTRFYSKFS